MDLLAYWKYNNYVRDLDEGAGFNFNSKQSRLHSAIQTGESLWLFTRVVPKSGLAQFRIAARLVVRSKTINPPGYKYGPYRIWGDLTHSRYYRVDSDAVNDAFELLQKLPLDSGSLGSCDRTTLPHACQTIRATTKPASGLLEAFCSDLPVEERAYKVVDEVKLENAYQRTLPYFESVVREDHGGVSDQRKLALYSSYTRNRQLVGELGSIYHGRCQLCGFDPLTLYSVEASEAHHIVYRSRGGDDILENLVLLCPNHHTVVHRNDATFDYAKLHFIFPNGRVEPLCINHHLRSRLAA